MHTIILHWKKDRFNISWSRFDSNILDDPRLVIQTPSKTSIFGVYIIWASQVDRTYLYAGTGLIKDRFEMHLRKNTLQRYKSRELYATWATLPLNVSLTLSTDQVIDTYQGIERYLGSVLHPVLSQRFPADVPPIRVNLP